MFVRNIRSGCLAMASKKGALNPHRANLSQPLLHQANSDFISFSRTHRIEPEYG